MRAARAGGAICGLLGVAEEEEEDQGPDNVGRNWAGGRRD